jgi:hypothetical protein
MGVSILYRIRIYVVMLAVYFMYYFIGFLFNTDMFNAITPQENGVSFSFIGIFLLLVTSLLILNVIDKYRKRNSN